MSDYTSQYWDSDDRQQMLGDVEVTVLNSFWSTPRIESKGKAQFEGADRVQMYWHCRIDEVYQEYDKVLPETIIVQFSVGDGYLSDEAGVMLSHKDDPSEEALAAGKAKPIQFKGGSMMGKFLGLCSGKYTSWFTRTNVDPMTKEPVVLDDGDDVEYDMSEARAFMARRHANPRNASIWVGTRWRLRGLGFYYKMTEGIPGMKPTPVAFLGTDDAVVEGFTPGATTSGQAAGGDVVVLPEFVSESLGQGVSAELVETLTDLVGSSTSHTSFMRSALQLADVKGNDDLKARIMDAVDGPWGQRGKTGEEEVEEESTTNPGLAAEQAADEAS